MVELAACLCFKDSASYLAEWLAFYRAVGVDRFYLYDNDSVDDFASIVAPYVDRGLAVLTHWPGARQQSAIYQHCLDVRKNETRWIAFMDDDEFLWPVQDPDLKAAMQRYETYAGVAACWFLYGSSHYTMPPPGLVTENYTWRTRLPLRAHVKCVVSAQRVIAPLYVGHGFICKRGYYLVDEHGHPITTAETSTPSGEFLRVNHYATKSLEELRQRRSRPRADNGQLSEHPLSLWEQWAGEWNQVEDRGILRFLPQVKATLEEFHPVWDMTAQVLGGNQTSSGC